MPPPFERQGGTGGLARLARAETLLFALVIERRELSIERNICGSSPLVV
jgi:hypothetical protein